MAARPAAAVAEESELEALRVRQLAADTHFHAEVRPCRPPICVRPCLLSAEVRPVPAPWLGVAGHSGWAFEVAVVGRESAVVELSTGRRRQVRGRRGVTARRGRGFCCLRWLCATWLTRRHCCGFAAVTAAGGTHALAACCPRDCLPTPSKGGHSPT